MANRGEAMSAHTPGPKTCKCKEPKVAYGITGFLLCRTCGRIAR